MKSKIYHLTILLVLFLNTSLFAQRTGPQSLAMLEESPAGSKIIQFIELLNNGKEVQEEDLSSLFSKRLIDKIGIQKLIGFLEEIRATDGALTLFEADRIDMFEYNTKLFGSESESWVDAEFAFKNAPPYKMDSFGISTTDEPSNNQEPLLGPQRTNSQATPLKNKSQAEVANKADELAKAYEDMGWFSGVILMAKDGQPFYQKAFGYADIANEIPNTINTKFRIGSINKTYTDILLLQLMEKGQLSLEDKLGKYLDGFPKATAQKISIKQMMTHTAGFSDIFMPKYIDNIRDYKTIYDILPLLRDEPLAYEPGTDQRYSNYGYIVLGAILEKITGKSYQTLLKENIFDVLGHTNTHCDIAENIEGEAKSYRYTLRGKKIDHTPLLEYPTPDGGMYSTAQELLEFMQSIFYDERLIKNESKLLKAFDFEPNDNYTWEKLLDNPNAVTADAGGGPGVNTLVEVALKDKFTIIILANTDNGIAEEIGIKLSRFHRGKKVKDPMLPLGHFVYQKIEKEGIDYVKANFKTLLNENDYGRPNPSILNQIGYDLLWEKQIDKAIEVFHANVDLYPEEANSYDSLAEAYYKKGDHKNAKKYYKKALEIDPGLSSAIEMLKEME